VDNREGALEQNEYLAEEQRDKYEAEHQSRLNQNRLAFMMQVSKIIKKTDKDQESSHNPDEERLWPYSNAQPHLDSGCKGKNTYTKGKVNQRCL